MARSDEQFNHRIPKELKEEFDAEAKANGRSATQHLVHVLKQRNNATQTSTRLEQFIENQEIFNKAMLDAISKGSKLTGLHEGNHIVTKKPWSKKGPNNAILTDSLLGYLPVRVVSILKDQCRIHTVKDLVDLVTKNKVKIAGIGSKLNQIINNFLMNNGFGWIDFK